MIRQIAMTLSWQFWCCTLAGSAVIVASVNLIAEEDLVGTPELAPPLQAAPTLAAALGDAQDLIKYQLAFQTFKDAGGNPLSGLGLKVAVIDTGIVKGHPDFQQGRIAAEVNLTGDNAAVASDASDGHGHGTHVAGIIGADGIHKGIARDANFVVMKILHNVEPQPGFPKNVNVRLFDALQWAYNQRNDQNVGVSVINLSISDPVLRKTDNFGNGIKNDIRRTIQDLRAARIPVVVAAGNHFRSGNSAERLKPLNCGMGFPAVIRETISVGAIYEAEDRTGHVHSPYDLAQSHSITRFQIAPFSARLPENLGGPCRTDILAPGGALMPSTGITMNGSSHYEHGGTSQAAPLVTAAILLLQQYYKSHTNELPLVDDLERWLRIEGRDVLDGDDEFDNVRHSCEKFFVLDLYGALDKAQKQIQSLEP